MSRGDKYARASGLAKIFKELLDKNSGSKAKAAGNMDKELGDEWRTEIIIGDEVGPELIDPAILEMKTEECDVHPEKVDDMYKKARKFSEDFVGPGDDLEFTPSEITADATKHEESSDEESDSDENPGESKDETSELVSLLKKLIKDLEK